MCPFSHLPFALSERKIDGQLYPERCSGLSSFWAFSPSLLGTSTVVRCPWANFLLGFLLRANHFVQGKTTEFQTKRGSEA